MATLSNLQDFNNQLQPIQTMVSEQKQGESYLKYMPSIMKEQRENFRAVVDVLSMMEEKGMISVNRPQQVVYQEEVEHLGFGKFLAILIGGCWFVIKLAALII